MFQRKELWCGDEKYQRHRIPGMIVTSRGTLLCYHEARRTPDDWSMMDILLSRSEDGGETFSPFVMLAKGSEAHPTVNNPVMVEDQQGAIHFLYCEDYAAKGGRVLERVSTDDGVTWSDPRDITHFTNPDGYSVFALGPGHGICLSNGILLISVWMVPSFYGAPARKHGPAAVTVLTSKDDGLHWELGDLLWTTREIVSPNETSAAEISGGAVYLNIRSHTSFRAAAVTDDAGKSWREYRLDRSLVDARCFGSVVSLEGGEKGRLLVFANCADCEQRKNVTLHVSFDEGKTWQIHKLIDAERGGYVELAYDGTREVFYLLYEENYGEKCHFATFDLEFLMSKD